MGSEERDQLTELKEQITRLHGRTMMLLYIIGTFSILNFIMTLSLHK